jgi:hypothetical protein
MAYEGFKKKSTEKSRSNVGVGMEDTPIPLSSKGEKKYKFQEGGEKSDSRMVFALIGALLFFIVIIIGAILFFFLGKTPAPLVPGNTTIIIQNITNATIIQCDDSCLLALALSTNSIEPCKNMSDGSSRSGCFIKFSNSSFDACLELEGAPEFVSCINHFAKSNNDSSICLKLNGTDATTCLVSVDPCYAKSGSEQKICLANEKNSVNACANDKECIYNFSINHKDINSCSILADNAEMYACRSLATGTDKCYDLALRSQRDLCYEIYAIRSDNPILCTPITPDGQYALECAMHFATKLNNFKLCDVVVLNNRWSCYSNYSLSTNNISGCMAIDKLAPTSRFACFNDFAKKFGDPSVCGQIGDEGFAISCYVGSVMNNTRLDVSKCSAINPIVWENKCFMQYAKIKNDSSFCNYIGTENERNSCVSTVK